MKKNKKKLFIACDTSKISKVKKILKSTQNKQHIWCVKTTNEYRDWNALRDEK